MEGGWVKVDRSVLDGPVMGSPELLQLYLYGMLQAAYATQWVHVKVGRGSTPVELQPGQWLFGKASVGKTLGQTPSSCWHRLHKLAALGLVTLECCPHWIVVTMPTSTTYGADGKMDRTAIEQQCDSNETAIEQQPNSNWTATGTYKKDKKEKKTKNTFAPSRPRTIPEPTPEPEAEGSWLLDDMAPEEVSEPMEPAEPEPATMPEALKPHRRIRWNRDEQRLDGIIETDIERWEAAYPAVDVHSALRQMEVWLAANPTKAVRRNYARFVINWLSREQERGGNRGRGPGKQPLVITDPDARTAELIRDLEMHQRR